MKSLYRKYRPVSLEEVVGQPQVTEPLESALKARKVNHAYLFVGPRGCGKTSVARIFAHEVNGFKYEIEDDYVDIIEIDGASNRGIDNIRELREKVAIAPTSGEYKVYIIDEVHMLTKEAFNALLKTLEEPPEHVIFIMATTDAYKVPVTITSRAQTFTFKLADAGVMMEHLKGICEKERIKIEDKALEVVVKRGGGSFRDSLSLLDQIATLSDSEITKEMVVAALGLPEDEKIGELLESYVQGDVVKITTIVKELLAGGIKAETLAEELIGAVVAEPRGEVLSLLGKLIEVKAPYAEARLLVALCSVSAAASGYSFSSPGLASSERHTLGSRENRPSGEPLGAVRNIRSSSANLEMAQKKNIPDAAGDADESNVAMASSAPVSNVSFDWNNFIEKVRAKDSGVAGQLANVRYEVQAGELIIYPDKSFIEKTLMRDKNKAILIECGGGMKVTVKSFKDFQNFGEKDALISKMSAIMGGEVQNDGGGNNPF